MRLICVFVLNLLWGTAGGQEPREDVSGILDEFLLPDDPAFVVVDPELAGAIASMEAGDNAAAAAEFDDILLSNPEHLQALRLQTSCYLRLNQTDQAISTCLQIASLDSLDASAQTTLGYLYQKAGDADNAELYFSLALERAPEAHLALFGLGWIYLERRNLDAAHDATTRIAEMAPDYAPNYVLLGRVLTLKGFYKDAARAFRRGFNLDRGLRTRYGILLQELTIRHRLSR